MGSFPPFPPPGRYSPSRAYGDFVPPSSSNHPFPPPAPNPYPQPYDPMAGPGRRPPPPFPFDAPKPSYDNDAYDPYQPSQQNTYDPSAPLRLSGSFPPPPRPPLPAPIPTLPLPSTRRTSPPRSYPAQSSYNNAAAQSSAQELTLLTDVTTVNLAGHPTALFSLPPSHLPIEKYIAVNAEDAFFVHRHFCSFANSVWYADGSSRAGEGWSAAVEWLTGPERSDKKMRGCVGDGDALDAELGGICKAVEGFLELLHLSLKDGKPMSHELVVFCDSQAAIVSIDTSSRSASIRFDDLWRTICTDYPHATLKLVWLPRQNNVEGYILADKIAVVGASNAYLKKRKEGTLPDIFRRPGGGEPAPPGSSEPGPWQRGDADPSRRKTPFRRPTPPPVSLVHSSSHQQEAEALLAEATSRHEDGTLEADQEDENAQPREGSIFVTHFPPEASAKDLGVLFAKYGDIVAVDIYHISSEHPRFAFVSYTDPAGGLAAIQELNRQPIRLEPVPEQEVEDDLALWRSWDGTLTVVQAEPPSLVPKSVLTEFPPLPDWALGSAKDARMNEQAEQQPDDASTGVKQEPEYSPSEATRKRLRDTPASAPPQSPPFSAVDSPSPHKRSKHELDGIAEKTNTSSQQTKSSSVAPADLPADSTHSNLTPVTGNVAHSAPPYLPPFPPTLKTGSQHLTPPPTNGISGRSTDYAKHGSQLPPTPNAAEKPRISSMQEDSPDRQASVEPGSLQLSGGAKRPLTNSAAEPQEYPIKIGAKTLKALISLVRTSFGKVDTTNWIAHACFIASDLDQARRALKEDLYATDGAFITGRDLEQILSGRGFTPQRVDTFINKVLKVLDGIAMAEQEEPENVKSEQDTIDQLEQELTQELSKYPDQTKEAVESASRLMEYLVRGKEAQEKKRLDVERRVKVLEGMVKIGEVVGGVVRFLLSEDRAG